MKRTALVTGANRGIGFDVCCQPARARIGVVTAALRQPLLDRRSRVRVYEKATSRQLGEQWDGTGPGQNLARVFGAV